LNVTGTVVATAIVPEPATVGMLAIGMAMEKVLGRTPPPRR
jgi:hypothetical protein